MGKIVTVVVILVVLLSTGFGQMTWTCATESAPWGPSAGHTSVVFDSRIWLLGGGGTVWSNDVWWSTDGVSWTCATDSAPWSARACHTSVVFDSKMWVIGGVRDGDYTELNDVWSSPNGVTWTCATSSAPWSARWNHASAVFDGKMWVLGGGLSNPVLNDVWWSTDGSNWTCATDSAGWTKRCAPALTVYHDTMWLMGGYRSWLSGNAFNDIWRSTDGATWTCATDSAEWTPRSGLQTVVANDTLWMAGGCPRDVKYRLNDVWYSTGGAWICATDSAEWLPRGWHTLVAYDGRLWVMGGDTTASEIAMNGVWSSAGLGVKESRQPQTPISRPGPTILAGASSVARLASDVVFDAMGRRVPDPKPGAYFVRGEPQAAGDKSQSVRKVIVTE